MCVIDLRLTDRNEVATRESMTGIRVLEISFGKVAFGTVEDDRQKLGSIL